MKVSDILHVKDNTLYTVAPEIELQAVVQMMVERDTGSLVVMEYGELVGMLASRGVIKVVAKSHGSMGGGIIIHKVMDGHPVTCTPGTGVNEVRHIMLEYHAYYLPIPDSRTLIGVILFYDITKAVLED